MTKNNEYDNLAFEMRGKNLNKDSINTVSKINVITNANHLLNNTFNNPKKINRNDTICDILNKHSVSLYNKLAFKFINHSKNTFTEHTFLSLHLKAKSVAYHISKLTNTKQERVLLLVPQSMEFLDAFFGCLYANAIAVPAYPPKLNRSITRLNTILNDCQPSVIITTSQLKEKINRLQEKYNLDFSGRWLCIDDIKTSDNIKYDENLFKITKDDIAFLQYTSGSTGNPKGVMVTHQNIMENELMIKDFFNHKSDDIVGVGWLPFFHDMGLIGNILQPMALGFPCILTPYIDIIQNPYLWLKLISDYKAFTSGGPNFIYNLCCEKITDEQKETLNLSNWKVAYNGAEPISAQTLKRFSKEFKRCGFEERNFYPCYGMAEATLIISGHSQGVLPTYKFIDCENLKENNIVEKSSLDNSTKTMVSSGYSHPKQVLRIVNPKTLKECKKNEVGEIWVNGPHVTKGYWNNDTLTNKTFKAKIKYSDCSLNYLRSGDLGFIDNNNALFITGRIKDTIIINGKNLYPHDIETLTENSHEAIRENSCACISIHDNTTEKIVIVAEIKRQFLRDKDHTKILAYINNKLHEQGYNIHDIVLIKTNSISKTSSGKLQRHLIKKNYIENTLSVITSSKLDFENKINPTNNINLRPPKNEIERDVIEIFKECLHHDKVSPEDHLSTLGIDSITFAQLTFQIEHKFFVSLTIDEISMLESIEELCLKIEEKQLDKLSNLDINMLQDFLIDFNQSENTSQQKQLLKLKT